MGGHLRSTALALAIAAAACDAQPGDYAPDRDPSRVVAPGRSDVSRSRLERAVCGYAARCRTTRANTVDECLELARRDPRFGLPEELSEALDVGAVGVVEAGLEACVDAIDALGCFPALRDPLRIEECEGAFEGRLVSGAACVTDLACPEGFACRASDADACVTLCRRLGDGECAGSGDCATGQVCVAGRCVGGTGGLIGVIGGLGGLATGQPCGAGLTCAPGLRCLPALTPTGFQCAVAPRENDACVPGFGPGCEPPFECVASGPGTGICRTVRGLGGGCIDSFDCGGPRTGFVCDPLLRTCVASPSFGRCAFVGSQGLCDPESAFCDLSLEDPACVSLRREGERCLGDSECGPATRCVPGLDGVRRCARGTSRCAVRASIVPLP